MGILDLSYVGEISLRSHAKKLFDKKSLRVSALRFIDSQGISVYRSKALRLGKSSHQNFAKLVFQKRPFLEKGDCPQIFNSVVEQSGRLRPDKSAWEIINNEYLKYSEIERILSKYDFSEVHEVITVNGRFTKNAAVTTWARNSHKKVSLIEFGSTNTKFEHFEIGPHSMIETEVKIEQLWENAPSDKVEVAKNFLKRDIKDRDPVGINWRAGMSTGKIPITDHRKTCTFFASTEAEYAGVGDVVPDGFFSNQKDAFIGLVKSLDPNLWKIFLRRHPSPPGREGLDAESHLWDEFGEVENIEIIAPDSDVDSFALGMNSDLVANFCSTLAMDFIASGKQQVITLGTAPWNSRIHSRFTPTLAHIKKFLEGPSEACSVEDTYPWAYFCATFGRNFQLLQFLPEKNRWGFIRE